MEANLGSGSSQVDTKSSLEETSSKKLFLQEDEDTMGFSKATVYGKSSFTTPVKLTQTEIAENLKYKTDDKYLNEKVLRKRDDPESDSLLNFGGFPSVNKRLKVDQFDLEFFGNEDSPSRDLAEKMINPVPSEKPSDEWSSIAIGLQGIDLAKKIRDTLDDKDSQSNSEEDKKDYSPNEPKSNHYDIPNLKSKALQMISVLQETKEKSENVLLDVLKARDSQTQARLTSLVPICPRPSTDLSQLEALNKPNLNPSFNRSTEVFPDLVNTFSFKELRLIKIFETIDLILRDIVVLDKTALFSCISQTANRCLQLSMNSSDLEVILGVYPYCYSILTIETPNDRIKEDYQLDFPEEDSVLVSFSSNLRNLTSPKNMICP